MYELLIGIPPFYDPIKRQMFEKIMYQEPKFPAKTLRPSAKDLMQRMLEKDPEKRIKISEIK